MQKIDNLCNPKSIKLTEEQLYWCERMMQKKGIKYLSQFLRDLIDENRKDNRSSKKVY